MSILICKSILLCLSLIGIVHLHVVGSIASSILMNVFQVQGICLADFTSLEYIPAVPGLVKLTCRTVLYVTALGNYIARCKLHGYWQQLLRVVGRNGKLKAVFACLYLIVYLADAVEMDVSVQSMFRVDEVDDTLSPDFIYRPQLVGDGTRSGVGRGIVGIVRNLSSIHRPV